MQGNYSYIPETNYVRREYSVAAILLLLFMVLKSLVSVFIIIIIIIIIIFIFKPFLQFRHLPFLERLLKAMTYGICFDQRSTATW